MSEFEADELHLKGRIQIETALRALVYAGINPDAQTRLQTFLDAHGQLSDGENQDDLSVYRQGEAVALLTTQQQMQQMTMKQLPTLETTTVSVVQVQHLQLRLVMVV